MSKASRSTSRRAAPSSDEKPKRQSKRKGVPEKWTIERRTAIVEQVCAHIAAGGVTIDLLPKHAADNEDLPTLKVFHFWLDEGQPNAEEYARQYARAREERLHVLEEQYLRTLYDGRNDLFYDVEAGRWRENTEVLGRARLQADGLKWYLSKLRRHRFGDTVDITSNGEAIAAVALPHVVPLGAPLDAADTQHKPQGKRGKR